MKKLYDKNTFTDMPLDASFPAPINNIKPKTATAKPKVNAIGKKANTETSKKKTTTTATTSKKQPEKKVEETSNTKKSSKEKSELEKLNEESLKTFRSGSKRNKIVIVFI